MAVNDFIKINTQVQTATHAGRLKQAIETLRRAIDELQFLRKTMEHMTNETDFVLIEELFGIEAGKGGTVYGLVNTSVSIGARNLTEQVGEMALSFVGGTFAESSAGANISPNLSALTGGTIASGDLVVVAAYTNGDPAVTPTLGEIGTALGYNELYELLTGSGFVYFRIAWKHYVSGEGNPTIIGSGTTNGNVASVLVFRGDDGAAPEITTAASINAAAIVPSVNDCIIAVFAGTLANDSSPGTMSPYTLVSAAWPSVNNTSLAASYRTLTGGAGVSEDPPTWSSFSGSFPQSATLAIRPGAEGQPYVKRVGGILGMNRAGLIGGGHQW